MRLTNQAAVMMTGRVAERAIGILSGIVLVRLLTKDDYGSFLQIALICQLAAALLVLGLPHSLLYLVPRAEQTFRKRLIVAAGRLIFALAIPGGIALALSGPLLSRAFNNPLLARLGTTIGVYVLVYSIDRMVEPALLALGKAGSAGVVAAVSAALFVVATLVPAWMGWGLQAMYGGVILVTVARLFYFGASLARLPGQGYGDRPAGFSNRSVLAFAIPMGFSAMATQYNRFLDGVMVSFLFTPAEYAVYARGAFELPLIDLVPYTLANVVLPRLVETWKSGDRAGFLALWSRLIRVSALCLVPAFAFCLMFADEIIVTLFSQEYRQSVPVFLVYLLSLPLRLTSFAIFLQAIGDSRAILNATLWSLGCSLLFSPAVCLVIGPVGAAVVYVASQCLWTLCLLQAIRRRTGLRAGDLLPWPFLARVTTLVVAVAVVIGALGILATSPLPRLALTGPVFVLLCLGGFARFNLLDASERDLLRRWMGRRRNPTRTVAHDDPASRDTPAAHGPH
ncbi:MAG: lipopolysaccharide biosynthesis protein [Tepidiformaceae bacterium]